MSIVLRAGQTSNVKSRDAFRGEIFVVEPLSNVMDRAEKMQVNVRVLPNGLKFVHHFMPDSAMVALNVLYGVGGRNEDADLTGIAHLFEHLMFGGSENVSDFDGILTEAGGISNAWTSNDFTNFYEIGPAHNAETLFYLESDRMLRPAILPTALEVQRAVVIEEFKQQCLNVPYGDTMHHLSALAYGNHPYSWPVIGKDFKGLEKVTRDQLVDWWRDNYSPSNAVLSCAGNIDFETAWGYALKWFGSIPDRPVKKKAFVPVANIVSEQTKIVRGPVPASIITIAFVMDPYGTGGYVAADAITDILSLGKASRFYQNIVMNPDSPIVEADASITGSEDRGLLLLSAKLANESVDIDEAKNYLLDAARSILCNPVGEQELQRTKNKVKSGLILSNSACATCARNIAMAAYHNEEPYDILNKYLALTPAKITEVAKQILEDSHPVILYYRPLEN